IQSLSYIYYQVLIPSSSGKAFGPDPAKKWADSGRLNPFFIREGFRSLPLSSLRLKANVLIPSSSGKAFGLLDARKQAKTMSYKCGSEEFRFL
ncbi:MAG: hypothetical protein ACLFMW_10705, partial [Ectothiorhodospira sp.]